MGILDIVRKIASARNLTQGVVRGIIDDYVECIIDALKAEGKFSLPGIGVLEVKHCNARPGVNPRTGEKVEIPEKNRVSFKCSKLLKDGLNKHE